MICLSFEAGIIREKLLSFYASVSVQFKLDIVFTLCNLYTYIFMLDLKTFSPCQYSTKMVRRDFNYKVSIKDLIESYNVPHTEIDLIIVNDNSVDFRYYVQNGDIIHVYPVCPIQGLAVATPLLHLVPPISDNPLFVVDVNLGRLARYLRLLGFDCLFCNRFDDATIANISSTTQRIVLTRDRKLLQRKIIRHGYFVRSNIPKTQVKEVLSRYKLHSKFKPLTRCTHCNGVLKKTEKQKIIHRLKHLTKKYHHKFLICPDCTQVYWQGSHSKHFKQLIDEFSEITGG